LENGRQPVQVQHLAVRVKDAMPGANHGAAKSDEPKAELVVDHILGTFA
jgi:hypothetical protein